MLIRTRTLAMIVTLTMMLIVWANAGQETLWAEDFRIDSKVFQGNDIEPHGTTSTIFSNGRVYDVQSKTQEITVFDLPGQQIRLIDPQRKLHAIMRIEQLDRLMIELQKRHDSATDPGMRFLLQPQFKQSPGSQPNERVFQSDYVTYQVETFAPRSSIIATQYREFSDLSAKLNALLNRGWPPFARLQVNAALVDEQLLPTKVTLLYTNKSFLNQKQLHFRTEHELFTRLTDSDQQRISQVADHLSASKAITLREYLERPTK
jgi:hypothetical protein